MNSEQQRALVEKHGVDNIIEKLEPYVSENRQQRINDVLSARLVSLQLAIESPSDINNALAAIRTCEALGISRVHIIQPEGDASYIRTVTQGAFYWVDVFFYSSLDAFLSYIRQQKLLLAGGTLRTDQSLHTVPVDKPLCMMIGNEQRGLTKEAENACDFLFKIPMVGMSESMNLSVSAAISLYDTSTRKRELLQQSGDLSSQQSAQLRAQYYLHSVNNRLVNALLK